MMKRLLDVAAAAAALAIASPLLLLIGLAVRIEAGSPVLFRQERVGRDGRIFEVVKFRTMRTDASGPQVTNVNDPRITRSGHWLRSTKLDELPQLVNVLRGEMSLVGPRPEVPKYVGLWPDEARDLVLSVRPGITDPASLRYRREAEELASVANAERYYAEVILPRKVDMYCEYVRSRSLVGDLRVLLRTLRTVAGS